MIPRMLVVQSCRSTRLSQHSLKRLRRWPRHVPASNSCSCLRQLGTVGTNISSRSSSVHFVAQRRNSDLAASSSDSSPRRDDDDATEQADVQSPNVVSWLRPLWNDAKSPMSNSRLEPSTVDRPLGMDASDIASPFSLEPFDIQDTELENAQLESNHEEQPDSSASVLLPDPKRTWPIDSALYPHVRACLSDIEFDDADLGSRDTGLSVCTLGTGAGNATRARCNTCTVVKNGSTSYLIDAGEGLQRQFLASRISFRDVRQIFITHLHGDHVFGLPGFLLNLQVSSLNANKAHAIEIYGPVGLYNYIATSLSLTNTELRKLTVEVYELHGGTQRSMRYAANRKTFAEFHHKGLYRKVIPQNADGTWTLVEPLEISTPELAIKHYSKPVGMSIKAAEIHHVPQLQCFGYTLQEPYTQPRSLDVDAARALGVTSSVSYRVLKSGFPVPNDDGTRVVQADEVCGPVPPSRKVTVLGDCCLVPPAMEMLAMNSDVLVHEATLSISDKGNKVAAGGHSSAAQAAVFANKVQAKVLLLNHLPKQVNAYKGVKDCLGEAESRIRGSTTRVQLGYDHLEVLIPRKGFEFDSRPTKSLWLHEREGAALADSTRPRAAVPSTERTKSVDLQQPSASQGTSNSLSESKQTDLAQSQSTSETAQQSTTRPSRRIRKLQKRLQEEAA